MEGSAPQIAHKHRPPDPTVHTGAPSTHRRGRRSRCGIACSTAKRISCSADREGDIRSGVLDARELHELPSGMLAPLASCGGDAAAAAAAADQPKGLPQCSARIFTSLGSSPSLGASKRALQVRLVGSRRHPPGVSAIAAAAPAEMKAWVWHSEFRYAQRAASATTAPIFMQPLLDAAETPPHANHCNRFASRYADR